MHYKSVLLGIAIMATAPLHAETDSAGIETLQRRIEKVLDKAGISFGGEFRSAHFGSAISGEGIRGKGRTVEPDEYSSVDFDIAARPNSSVSGRCVLRLHHNWQNFWSDPGNPIFTRWISVDGSVAGAAPFHVGDMRIRHSPLTIYAPEIDIMYEPAIFARLRRIAMNEVFLGDNERPLQGAAVGFDGALAPLFDELHGSLVGARLRSVQVSLENNILVVNPFEAHPDFEKLCFGSMLDTRFLKGLSLGGSYLLIADYKGSSKKSDTVADTTAQRTAVTAVRGGCDAAPWIGLSDGRLKMYGEAAFSFDDTAWYEAGDVQRLRRDDIAGSAMYGGISCLMKIFSAFSVDLDIRYIRNEPLFRNELAQSPTFIGKRIMNIESDSLYLSTPVPSHYSTFDALYHTVFKFCPSGKTNAWQEAPFSKNAYSAIVNTQYELSRVVAGSLDPSVQLIMPFGPATPNRQGFAADITARLSGAELRLLFKSLSERTPALDAAANATAALLQRGMGLRVDLASVLKRLRYPLELSGGFVRSSAAAENDAFKIQSDLSNAGLYWKFWKHTAVLAGVQMIDNRYRIHAVNADRSEQHWSTGLNWSITDGADVIGSIGRIDVHNSNVVKAATGPERFSRGDYSFLLNEVSLKVNF